jgi:hypothetical protein
MSSDRNPSSPRAGAVSGDDGASGVARPQVDDLTATGRGGLGDGADVLVGDVDDGPFQRLVGGSVDLADDDLGAAHLDLVPLAPHRLDEHGELQLSAACDLDDVGAGRRSDPDRHVAEHLALEALPDLTGGEEPSRTGEGDVFTPKVIRSTGSSTSSLGSGCGSVASASVSPISTSGNPATTKRSPATRSSAFDPAETGETEELGEPATQRGLVLGGVAQGHRLPGPQGSLHHPADGEPAEVVGGVEIGDEGLYRGGRVAGGSGDARHDRLEERREVVVLAQGPDPGNAATGTSDGGDDGELDVGVGGVQVEEELVHLVDHLVGPGVGAVHLVEDHDRGKAHGQRLRQHVPGLGHGPIGGVDEEEHSVDHGQGPLHLATEVGVAGCVDQVELDPIPLDRGRLGEDGDAALALLIARVHDAVDPLSWDANTPAAASMASTSVVLP